MIKVITHGRFRKHTCSECGCEFSYEKEDLHYVQTAINDCEWRITCPECGKEDVAKGRFAWDGGE